MDVVVDFAKVFQEHTEHLNTMTAAILTPEKDNLSDCYMCVANRARSLSIKNQKWLEDKVWGLLSQALAREEEDENSYRMPFYEEPSDSSLTLQFLKSYH